MILHPHKDIIYESEVTCPGCGYKETKTMKPGTVEQLYQCPSCKKTYKEKPGTCCIYCSYGNKSCPTIQDIQLKLNHCE